jgi:hypothetical protein
MVHKDDLPNGKWNEELAKRLEKDSTHKLYCKNCGSTEFNIYENRCFTDYRTVFATVEACAKCGLVAHSTNLTPWQSDFYKEHNDKPIDSYFLTSFPTINKK